VLVNRHVVRLPWRDFRRCGQSAIVAFQVEAVDQPTGQEDVAGPHVARQERKSIIRESTCLLVAGDAQPLPKQFLDAVLAEIDLHLIAIAED
jgi:hypothetical protein